MSFNRIGLMIKIIKCNLYHKLKSECVLDNHHEISHIRQVSPRVRVDTRSSADADNGLDAFSGQSRSTNMVPFHMLHIVSYCTIVTLSLRYSSSKKKNHDLEMGSKVTQGH